MSAVVSAVDGRSGGHSPRHMPHAEPRLYVTADHRGQAAVGGCPRCADPASVVQMLRDLADRIEQATATPPAGGAA